MMRNIVATIVLVCASLMGFAQTNIINTIAGCGIAGYSGDGGAATSAKLHAPYMMCIDRSRNVLYIADAYNNVIRKVDLSTNTITTFAGNGTGGFSGDNGLAIGAELLAPEGLCVDNYGNLYIADASNSRIRKVDISTKIITTCAGTGGTGHSGDGGLAINAEIGGPIGLFIDGQNNMYFTDYLNHLVRKVDGVSGVITTIAGTGLLGYSGDGGQAINATLNVPCDVALDATGNIIIADTWNNVIRRVDKNTNLISTIAGTGVAGYSGDGSPAISAQLNQPDGMILDAAGNILFADLNNGCIRKIENSNGIITRIAGTGIPGYSGDGGLALDAQLFCSDVDFDSHGNMIIDDYQNDRIRRVSSSVGIVTVNSLPFTIYPNPTAGILHVKTATTAVKTNLSATNSLGQEVFRQTLTGDNDIDLTSLPNGIYFVRIDAGVEQHTEKVTVIR